MGSSYQMDAIEVVWVYSTGGEMGPENVPSHPSTPEMRTRCMGLCMEVYAWT